MVCCEDFNMAFTAESKYRNDTNQQLMKTCTPVPSLIQSLLEVEVVSELFIGSSNLSLHHEFLREMNFIALVVAPRD